ncbi:hypothetical protein GY45DRAFT_250235 [Cubamyces sp. BRFM 1775]|nr:hypothetical protein GY45DRAFT_250235 [Cubamyces sp. BRFM 1775]
MVDDGLDTCVHAWYYKRFAVAHTERQAGNFPRPRKRRVDMHAVDCLSICTYNQVGNPLDFDVCFNTTTAHPTALGSSTLYPRMSIASTPCETADVLRADGLFRPYYGLPPLEGDPKTTRAVTEADISSLRAHHNSLVPINQLPPELLIMIMSWVQYSPFYYQYHYAGWSEILEVCRHWFVVGATAPSLWRTISPGTKINHAWVTLARSKQATIAVAVASQHGLTRCALLAGITPHAHHLRELYLTELSFCNKELLAEVMKCMPMLEVLRVSLQLFRSGSVLDRDIIRGMQLTPTQFPRLRRVSARGIYLPDATVWQQLHTLCLDGCLGISLDSLISMVQGCTHIVQLDISNSTVFPEGEGPVSPAPPSWIGYKIPLRKLQKLNIGMEPWVTKRILSAIIIPSTAQVTLDCVMKETSTEAELTSGFLAAMPDDLSGMPILQSKHMIQGVSRVLGQRRSLSLHSNTHYHSLWDKIDISDTPESDEARGPSFSFNLYNDRLRMYNSLLIDDVLTIMHHAPLETFHVELSASKANLVDWRALLRPLNLLRELTVSYWFDSGRGPSTLRCIFTVLDTQDTQHRDIFPREVLCPALRYVKITGLNVSRNPELRGDLAHARECLFRRGRALGRPSLGVDELVLVVGFYRSQQEFEEDKAQALGMLAPVVGRLVYERDRHDRDDPNICQQDSRFHTRATKNVLAFLEQMLRIVVTSVACSLCH